jgi:hypothetical protein
MKMVKSAALVVMSGWLMGVSASAWAAMPAGNMAPPNHAEVIAAANGPLFATEGSLEPSLALQVARQDHGKCRASHIYAALMWWAIRTRASWAAMRCQVPTEAGWQLAAVELLGCTAGARVPSAGAGLCRRNMLSAAPSPIAEEPPINLKTKANGFAVPWHSSSNPMISLNQASWCQAYKLDRATKVLRHRKVAQVLCGWLAAAVFVAVAVGAPGCSTQQNRIPVEAQNKDLPAVGSLDDYLAQGSNDCPHMYASYGSCDPFMIDPFWSAPCWYAGPVYYFPGRRFRHYSPISAAGGSPPPAREMHPAVASSAPSTPLDSAHIGGFSSGMRGFGAGQMGGGRR